VLLGYDSVQADMSAPLQKAPNTPVHDVYVSPNVSQDTFIPLRDVIRQFSGKTGIQVKLSQDLQDDEEALKKLYSSRDDTWLENFSRVEYDNEQTGKKEIILLKSRYYDASKIPDSTVSRRPPKPRDHTPQDDPDAYQQQQGAKAYPPNAEENDGGLPREKLFKLMRFPFKGPFSDEWFEDEDYRQFLSQLQIHSPDALKDRRTVMKIRNEARKQFRERRARR
jgi:hypothetical protein